MSSVRHGPLGSAWCLVYNSKGIFKTYWNTEVYFYWRGKFQPIEDEV